MTDRTDLTWRTSTRSAGADCVEIAVDEGRALIRDSKDPAGPVLDFPLAAFREFIAQVKRD